MKAEPNSRRLLFLVAPLLIISHAYCQDFTDPSRKNPMDLYSRHSIGSTVFLLGNFIPGDLPYFFLLNYGYKFGASDILFSEIITWTYYEPLGTYGSSDQGYPGRIRAVGIGFGYQRFFWRGLYTSAQAVSFYQQFFNKENKEISLGYQLYLQSRFGYRFKFFENRWYLEPSLAFNYWPINTSFPIEFKNVEDGKPNYFLFEPGLHFGFNL